MNHLTKIKFNLCRSHYLNSHYLKSHAYLINKLFSTEPETNSQQNSKQHIQYLSDTHVDRFKQNDLFNLCKSIEKTKVSDTLILAGDIGAPQSNNWNYFMDSMSSTFDKIYFVAGNHDYECSSGYNLNNYNHWRKYFNNYVSKSKNVFFLDRQVITLNDHYVIAGCTLWSHIQNVENIKLKYGDMNEYNNRIKIHNEAFKQDVTWLTKTISNNIKNNMKTIIVTHFLPTSSLIAKKYLNQNGVPNSFFVTDLEYLMSEKTYLIGFVDIRILF